MTKYPFSVVDLDNIANHFYLQGFVVGRVKETVPSNFKEDDPFQDKVVPGISINRVFDDGQFSEVIVLSSGVVFLKVEYQGNVTNIQGAYPLNLNYAIGCVEQLVKEQKEV
jgi:hypothetical protein